MLFCRRTNDADGLYVHSEDRDALQKAASKACRKKDRWDGTLSQFANEFALLD